LLLYVLIVLLLMLAGKSKESSAKRLVSVLEASRLMELETEKNEALEEIDNKYAKEKKRLGSLLNALYGNAAGKVRTLNKETLNLYVEMKKHEIKRCSAESAAWYTTGRNDSWDLFLWATAVGMLLLIVLSALYVRRPSVNNDFP